MKDMGSMRDVITDMVDSMIDEDELYNAIREEVAARIDYADIAEAVVNTIGLNDLILEYLDLLPF